MLDLGQSSGGEESDGGLETSRVVYSSYKPPDNRSTGKTGKLANLWDSFLGNKVRNISIKFARKTTSIAVVNFSSMRFGLKISEKESYWPDLN